MYPRNNASPPPIAIGEVRAISDGALQTADVLVRVKTGSGDWAAGGGSLACDATSGCWTYAPTQGETNATSFAVAIYKASCTGAQQTIVTTAESTPGTVKLGAAQTADITGSLSGSVGSVTGAVGSVTAEVTPTAASKTGYALTAAYDAAKTAGTSTLTAQQVWEYGTRTMSSYGTLVADVAAAVWAIATSTLTGAGTIGKWIVDNLNATVGSRSSHSAGDVASLILATPANKLATDASGYVTYGNAAPPSVSAIASQIRTELATELARIDQAISSRQATVANLSNVVTMAAQFSTMIVLDGAVYDFTSAALAAAPGGGTGLTAQEVRDAMKLAPTAGSPSDGSVDKHLDTIEAATGSLSGSGARTVTITVNDGATALESARVRVTKGALSYVLATNAVGVATFNLDDGTWTVAITLAGYTFAGATLVVDGDEAATYSMSAAASANPDPDMVNVVVTCFDEEGAAEQGVEITVKLTKPPAADTGHVFDTAEHTYTSDSNGVVTFALWLGATYLWRRGAGPWKAFTPNADPYAISSHAGEE